VILSPATLVVSNFVTFHFLDTKVVPIDVTRRALAESEVAGFQF